jgi:hypothetical protein
MERVVLKGEDPYYDRFAISQVNMAVSVPPSLLLNAGHQALMV